MAIGVDTATTRRIKKYDLVIMKMFGGLSEESEGASHLHLGVLADPEPDLLRPGALERRGADDERRHLVLVLEGQPDRLAEATAV